jgi:Flp pilus assembly protein protease CpaA
MMSLLLIVISLFDFFTHRIPNRLLLLLIIWLFISGEISAHLLYGVLVTLAAFGAYLLFGLGAGDVKLISIIALFLTPTGAIMNYWFFVSLIGISLMTLHFVLFRTFKGNIALSPALCGAVLGISW